MLLSMDIGFVRCLVCYLAFFGPTWATLEDSLDLLLRENFNVTEELAKEFSLFEKINYRASNGFWSIYIPGTARYLRGSFARVHIIEIDSKSLTSVAFSILFELEFTVQMKCKIYNVDNILEGRTKFSFYYKIKNMHSRVELASRRMGSACVIYLKKITTENPKSKMLNTEKWAKNGTEIIRTKLNIQVQKKLVLYINRMLLKTYEPELIGHHFCPDLYLRN